MMKHALVVVALVACGPKPAPRGPGGLAGLLAHVPADAPFVIATLEPVTVDDYRAFRRVFGPAIELAMTRKPDPEAQRAFEALGDELGAALDERHIEELGFNARPHVVVYGLGLAVVVARIELRDRAHAIATIERVARKADKPLGPATERSGYRIYRGKRAAYAFGPDDLVAAFGAEADLDRALERILARPARSVADTGAITDAVARHHLAKRLVAIVDTEQMLRASAERAGLHPSGTCARALADAAKLAPRLVGSMTFEAHRQSGVVIVELAPQLRAAVAALRVPLPAADQLFATRRLVNLAVGVDVVGAQRVFVDVMRVLVPAATACGWHDLERETGNLVAKYGVKLWSGFDVAHGVVGSLVTLAPGTGTLPDRLEAFALLYGIPPDLVELAAQAGVPADDQMHAVELAQWKLHLPYRIVAQLGHGSGALAIGDKTELLATRALAAQGTAPAPLFHLGMDYGRIMELTARSGGKDRDMTALMAAVYGYSDMAVDVTDDGLVGAFSWELK